MTTLVVKLAIFIDTELWIFAQKAPNPSEAPNDSDYKRALQLHKLSSDFIKQKISQNEISMTYHQLCEIYHVLGFRGMRLPKEFVQEYCFKLLQAKFMRWYQISPENLQQAINLSNRSNIHIWDFLCVLPLYEDVNVIYTCDEHFKHPSFQSLGPPIKNPLNEWLVL